MFSATKAKISGIKTYLVATGLICGALVAWQQDQIGAWEAVKTIGIALGMITGRAAISKAQDAAGAAAPVITVHPGGTVNVTSGGVGPGSTDVNADQH